ncbi:MAG: ABC transporter ATP-binding protein [Planctomycetes bacterium]|nr:ABC transporter ATP-binding protein [Planctomycetota bacterium]
MQKTYRSGLFGGCRVEALRGVTFRVERGEIFGLLGPNGAGKTTLIKILLGIVRRTHGEATLLGHAAGDRNGRIRVGYLPENHRIPRHHTGNSALFYYGGLSGLSRGEVRRRAPALLDKVGLGKWGTTNVGSYSKGMLQRLGLAQAMLHEPELLILDEPTDGVDPVGRSEMREVLRDLKQQGKTIFLNSHLLQEIELVCDRVAILDHGLVLREGPVAEIKHTTGVAMQASSELRFSLVASELAAREALQGFEFGPLQITAEGQVQVTVRAADQGTVDRCLDQLRQRGISVVEMSRRRLTLEEAFLNIVQATAAE